MSELRCPCGHEIKRHGESGCIDADVCMCANSQLKAYRTAQRKAAAEYLLRLLRERWSAKHYGGNLEVVRTEIHHARVAYRAIGVFGKRRGGGE